MKKIILFIISLFVLLLTIQTTSASGSYNLTYTIKNGVVEVQHSVETNNSFETIMPEDYYNFDVLVNQKYSSSFNLSKEGEYKKLSLVLPEKQNKVNITYLTSSFLEKSDNNYFIGSVKILQNIEEFNVKAILPEDSFLARSLSSFNSPISPNPSSVETNGKQIIIEWNNINKTQSDTFSFFVVYKQKNQFNPYLILFFMVIIGLIIYYFKKRKSLLPEDSPYSHLLESEQKIISALLKNENKTMWQKELQIAVGFTKSKLSRTIRNMEERNLIEKQPYGATNKIKLIENEKNEILF